jgi:hypothetical protein
MFHAKVGVMQEQNGISITDSSTKITDWIARLRMTRF